MRLFIAARVVNQLASLVVVDGLIVGYPGRINQPTHPLAIGPITLAYLALPQLRSTPAPNWRFYLSPTLLCHVVASHQELGRQQQILILVPVNIEKNVFE